MRLILRILTVFFIAIVLSSPVRFAYAAEPLDPVTTVENLVQQTIAAITPPTMSAPVSSPPEMQMRVALREARAAHLTAVIADKAQPATSGVLSGMRTAGQQLSRALLFTASAWSEWVALANSDLTSRVSLNDASPPARVAPPTAVANAPPTLATTLSAAPTAYLASSAGASSGQSITGTDALPPKIVSTEFNLAKQNATNSDSGEKYQLNALAEYLRTLVYQTLASTTPASIPDYIATSGNSANTYAANSAKLADVIASAVSDSPSAVGALPKTATPAFNAASVWNAWTGWLSQLLYPPSVPARFAQLTPAPNVATSVKPPTIQAPVTAAAPRNIQVGYPAPLESGAPTYPSESPIIVSTPSGQLNGFVTQDQLTALAQNLRSLVYQTLASAPPASIPEYIAASGNPVNPYAANSAIDQLNGTKLTNITVNGVSGLTAADIPSLSGTYLPLTGGTVTGTSTLATTTVNGTLTINGNTNVTQGGDLTVGDKVIAPGDIGVGTSTPYAKLSIQNTIATQTAFAIVGTTTQSSPLVDVWDNLGDNFFHISASGYVGIGTSSPSDLLAVNGPIYLGATTSNQTTNRLYNSGGTLYWNGTQLAIGGAGVSTTTANTWSQLQTFASGFISQASSTISAAFNSTLSNSLASTTLTGPTLAAGSLTVNGQTTLTNASSSALTSTNLFSTLASSTNLIISGIHSALLKTDANGVVSGAVAGTDYENPLTFTYPLTRSTNTVSLAFGTTTSNTWAGTQTFTNTPVLGALSGLIGANNGSLYQISTSTLLTFGGGLISQASSTFTGTLNAGALALVNALTVPNGGTGQTSFTTGNLLYGAGSGALQNVATSSLTAGTALSFSGTPGALVGGTNLTINFAAPTNSALVIPYASSTAITVSGTGYFSTASTTNLTVSGTPSALLKTSASGAVSGAVAGTDYITPAGLTSFYDFPLTGNATSTLAQFNGGLTAYASSTIGNGTQAGGLTISGGATTTGGFAITSAGSAAAPSLSVGNSTTGFYSVSNTGFGISVNGTSEADWGIGTVNFWTLGPNLKAATNGVIQVAGTGAFRLQNGGTIISSPVSAVLQFGAADAVSPVAQTLQVQNVAAGTTDTAGQNFTINGSRGTGLGAGGSILFQTAPAAGSTGTAQNVLVTALTITSAGNVGIGTTTPGFPFSIQGTSGTLLQVSNSATSEFKVDSSGNLTANGGLTVGTFNAITWINRSSLSTPSAGLITVGGNANVTFGVPGSTNNVFQFGAAAGSSPAAQTIQFQSGSGSNVAGQNATVIGSLGTGNASSGDINFQTGGPVSGSGSTAATALTALTIKGVTQNVGIGTTSPYALLSISNSATTAANTPLFTIASTTGGNSTSTLLTVLANGNVNVGTAGSAAAPSLSVGNLTTGLYSSGTTGLCFADVNGTCEADYGISHSGFLRFATYAFLSGGGESDGNFNVLGGALNINTTNNTITGPSAHTLQLGSTDDTAANIFAQTLQVQNVSAGQSNGGGQNFTINGSRGTGTGVGGSILFQTAPAAGSTGTAQNALVTALTITGAGNVGIGTSTPYSRLTVWGPDTSGSTGAFLVANSASTTEFVVNDNGSATLAGTLTQNSDQRLKTNIQLLDASSSLSLIDALNPVTFNWIDPALGTTPQIGFIAQQVQQIFPNLVSTTSATALTPGGTLGLNYIGLISPIISAIQALSGEVQGLIAEVQGFAQKFTTNQLCVNKSDGTPVCVTGDQLSTLLAAQGQQEILSPSPAAGPVATTPPTIAINGDNPANINVGDAYSDLGASITGPQADLNLGIKTFLNGALVSNIVIDTSQVATDTIDYVATDQSGLTSTSTRIVIIDSSPSIVPAANASTTATTDSTSTEATPTTQ